MQGDADEKDQSSEISFDAVKSLMSNTGYPAFSYDVFKRLYDQGKTLKNVVADFNKEKIVRNPKTNEKLFKNQSYKLHFKIGKILHKKINGFADSDVENEV